VQQNISEYNQPVTVTPQQSSNSTTLIVVFSLLGLFCMIVLLSNINGAKDSSSRIESSNNTTDMTDISSSTEATTPLNNSTATETYSNNTDELVAGYIGRVAEDTPVARTKEDFKAINRYANARDMEGWARMVYEGRMAILPVGTSIRIISKGWYYQIRVLDGDYAGEEFYIEPELIR